MHPEAAVRGAGIGFNNSPQRNRLLHAPRIPAFRSDGFFWPRCTECTLDMFVLTTGECGSRFMSVACQGPTRYHRVFIYSNLDGEYT